MKERNGKEERWKEGKKKEMQGGREGKRERVKESHYHQLDLNDIYITLHWATAECTYFSVAHGTYFIICSLKRLKNNKPLAILKKKIVGR